MKYNKKYIKDVDFSGKTAIVRLDLDVPLRNGKIDNGKKIISSLETIKYLIDKKAKIIILSHLGRIKLFSEISNGKKSLKIIYERIAELLPGTKVFFSHESTGEQVRKKVKNLKPAEILILENTRYNDFNDKGENVKLESKNDNNLGKYWASLADVFVHDAFGIAHRSHASNVGIATNIKESCIGFLIQRELKMLMKIYNNPKKPLIAIIGGSKISDKIKTISQIGKIADKILIGGGMAYTFLKSKDYEIGNSLCDDNSIPMAKKLLEELKGKIVLPLDSACSNSIKENKYPIFRKNEDGISKEMMGLDIGPKTIKLFSEILKGKKTIFGKVKIEQAKTVIWNGPLGVNELSHFNRGTEEICKVLADIKENECFTLVGGGDTDSAIIKLGFEHDFSYISTGGGATLSFFEGNNLPGIDSISNRNKR
ncbi:MAG: phosphoglycerate kinase [Metamycoplasmataceae bacterium]